MNQDNEASDIYEIKEKICSNMDWMDFGDSMFNGNLTRHFAMRTSELFMDSNQNLMSSKQMQFL